MRSGNSPNKFLKGLGKKALGVMGGAAGKLLGGGGGGGRASEEQVLAAQRTGALTRGGGGIWGGGDPNLPGGMFNTKHPILQQGAPGMTPGAFPKRIGFKKYNCPVCPSPLKGADAVLVRGAYDAASGKGTTKYGQIAKARAFSDITKTIGETTASWARVQAPKRRISMKKNLKNQMKTNKLRQRKSKGWIDKMRYA
jgi:hypothetical protein